MKKLIFFVWLLCSFTKVYATEDEMWKDYIMNDSDFYIMNAEIRYKWYTEAKIFSNDYYIENENNLEYPNIDKNKFIVTDFSEWNNVNPPPKKNRIIELKPARRYRTFKPVRYIILNNFDGSGESFFINELSIFYEHRELDIEVICTKCAPDFPTAVKDGKYSTNSFIEEGGILTIDLGSYHSVEKLLFEMFVHYKIKNNKKFDFYFKESLLSDKNSGSKRIILDITSNNSQRPIDFLLNFDSTYDYDFDFGNWVYIEGALNTTFYRQMQYLTLYRYKDIKYQYYKMERTYLDDYYTKLIFNDHLKDESSAKIFYSYGKREKDITQNHNNICDNDNPSKNENNKEDVLLENSASQTIAVCEPLESPVNEDGFIGNVNSVNDKINQRIIVKKEIITKDCVAIDNSQLKEKNKLIPINQQDNSKKKTLSTESKSNLFYFLLILLLILIIILLLFRYLKRRHQKLSHQK
ncbi:MAG: hypothetical protein PHT75_02785 [Bacilli bacterium]|nr:hypothetical protein [Bacilli bacterium]MDD3305036.1 hypothetical protein [Bacilli bacterium]MDD4053633.1 hypothetical protein [Bacilli bacterium]MDD4411132.1 hypothetical protein [Bacilli bacterium]